MRVRRDSAEIHLDLLAEAAGDALERAATERKTLQHLADTRASLLADARPPADRSNRAG